MPVFIPSFLFPYHPSFFFFLRHDVYVHMLEKINDLPVLFYIYLFFLIPSLLFSLFYCLEMLPSFLLNVLPSFLSILFSISLPSLFFFSFHQYLIASSVYKMHIYVSFLSFSSVMRFFAFPFIIFFAYI